jgi:hypothetical protein
MARKLIFLVLTFVCVCSTSIQAQSRQVELFDIKLDKVTKTMPVNRSFQEHAKGYLNNIDNIYTKINPIPKNGYMIKIPLETPIRVNNQWINSYVDEVIVVLPDGEDPYLMTFDEDNRIHILTFKGDTEFLFKTFNLNLKAHSYNNK